MTSMISWQVAQARSHETTASDVSRSELPRLPRRWRRLGGRGRG